MYKYEKILELVDSAVIENHLYFLMTDMSNNKLIEIEYNKKIKDKWRFRYKGELLWELSRKETLIEDLLNYCDIDPELFYDYVKREVLIQVTFANKIVNEAAEVLGAEPVNHAIESMNEFFNSISELVKNLDNDGKKKITKLSVVK